VVPEVAASHLRALGSVGPPLLDHDTRGSEPLDCSIVEAVPPKTSCTTSAFEIGSAHTGRSTGRVKFEPKFEHAPAHHLGFRPTCPPGGKKREELARVMECLRSPDLSQGIARELQKQNA
jgi:hypothetical protein